MVELATFVLMNGLVFAGAALVSRFGLKIRDGVGLLLSAALLGWVFIVVGLEVLGTFGQIRLGPAFGLAAVGFATGLVLSWCSRETPVGSEGRVETGSPAAPRKLLVNLCAALAGVLAAWAAAEVLITSLAGPVQVVSDAPIYHLYFAIRWWKAGALELVPTPFGDSAAPYFPANADVWFTWLILPWSRETVAKVGQWPFLIIVMLAGYALAREVCSRRELAIFAAALWGTSTPPLWHAGWADVDLVMAAWYVVAVWFLVRYARSHAMPDLLCAGLAAGASLGTKYVALLFVPWLLAAALALVWRAPQRWGHLAVLAGCLLLPCAYWLGRNLFLTGNPLYPLHFELLGVPLLRGWYDRTTLLTNQQYHVPADQLRVLLAILLRAADPLLVPVWLSGIAAAVWAALRRQWLIGLLVGLGCLHVVLYWWVNPYQSPEQQRFLFAAFALLAVPVVLAIERWPMLAVVFVAMLGLHLVVGFDPGEHTNVPLLSAALAPGGALKRFTIAWGDLVLKPHVVELTARRAMLLATVALAGAVLIPRRGPWQRRAVAAGAAAIALACGAWAAWSEQTARLAHEPWLRFYPVWRDDLGYVEGWHRLQALSDRPLRVAYAGTNLPYYLFGIGLKNDVRYVNINRHADSLMHDYHAQFARRGEPRATTPTPDWDRREADEAAWLKNLRDQRVDVLFVGRTNVAGGRNNVYDRQYFPIERTWADRHPESLHLLFEGPTVRLYAVRFR